MKTLTVVILVLLLLSIARNVWRWSVSRNRDNVARIESQERLAEIAKHQATAVSYADSARLERAKRLADSLKYSLAVSGLKMRNSAMSKKLVEMRVDVQPFLDSIQVVGDFVALQDSSLNQKDSIIMVLEDQNYTQAKLFSAEINHMGSQIEQEKEIAGLWEDQALNYQKLFHTADKKARKKFTVGPFVGYGVGNSGLTPSVGISLQYTLFRF